MPTRQGMPRIDIRSLAPEDAAEIKRLSARIVALSLRYDEENTDPDNAVVTEAMWALCKLYEGSDDDALFGDNQTATAH